MNRFLFTDIILFRNDFVVVVVDVVVVFQWGKETLRAGLSGPVLA